MASKIEELKERAVKEPGKEISWKADGWHFSIKCEKTKLDAAVPQVRDYLRGAENLPLDVCHTWLFAMRQISNRNGQTVESETEIVKKWVEPFGGLLEDYQPRASKQLQCLFFVWLEVDGVHRTMPWTTMEIPAQGTAKPAPGPTPTDLASASEQAAVPPTNSAPSGTEGAEGAPLLSPFTRGAQRIPNATMGLPHLRLVPGSNKPS